MIIGSAKISFSINCLDQGVAFFDEDLSEGNLRVFVDSGSTLELLKGD